MFKLNELSHIASLKLHLKLVSLISTHIHTPQQVMWSDCSEGVWEHASFNEVNREFSKTEEDILFQLSQVLLLRLLYVSTST